MDMTRRKTLLLRCATAAGLVTLLAGCNGSFAGSGTVTTPNGLAATSFELKCSVTTQAASGFLSYKDPAARIRFYSEALQLTSGIPDDVSSFVSGVTGRSAVSLGDE